MQPSQPSFEQFQSEGDLNLSPERAAWSDEHIDAETRNWLEEGTKY